MLALKPLRQDQYRQVAEWEFGPQADNADWQRYEAEMNAPQWAHFGLYDGADFMGCVSFERINSQTMAYHVVTARRKIRPQSLAQVLLKTVGFFFRRGFTSLVAHIPENNVAAARLALRCGMREYERMNKERRFILSRACHWKLNDA
jgi:RimJ/RimL family protein N-acetyltransferase